MHAGYDTIGEDRAARGHAGLELCSGGDGGIQQELVEVAPRDRGASQAMRIVGAHLRATGASDGHPGNGQRPLFTSVDTPTPEPVEDRQRAGIERVAAQLVARELARDR